MFTFCDIICVLKYERIQKAIDSNGFCLFPLKHCHIQTKYVFIVTTLICYLHNIIIIILNRSDSLMILQIYEFVLLYCGI